MKLVDAKPFVTRRPQGHLIPVIEEFCAMNVKSMKVEYDPGEYRDRRACYMAFYRSLQCYSQYPVKVRFYNREVFLVRTDMD